MFLLTKRKPTFDVWIESQGRNWKWHVSTMRNNEGLLKNIPTAQVNGIRFLVLIRRWKNERKKERVPE